MHTYQAFLAVQFFRAEPLPEPSRRLKRLIVWNGGWAERISSTSPRAVPGQSVAEPLNCLQGAEMPSPRAGMG